VGKMVTTQTRATDEHRIACSPGSGIDGSAREMMLIGDAQPTHGLSVLQTRVESRMY
jgi:hypothetical protein